MSPPVCMEFEQLAEFATEVSDWRPVPYPLLSIAQHEKECGSGMTFYTDRWPSCSAAVAVPGPLCDFPFLQKAVYVGAINLETLYDVLRLAPIDWTKEFYFVAVYQTVYPVCEAVCEQHGTLDASILAHTMVQTSAADVQDLTLPEEFFSDELKIGDVSLIVSHWPQIRDYFSEEVFRHRVEHSILLHPTVAIRDQKGNLVAYEMIAPHGTMSMLFVKPEHRRKGLAAIVVSELCKKLQLKGMYRTIHVSDENEASIKLHTTCGFTIEEGTDLIWKKFTPK